MDEIFQAFDYLELLITLNQTALNIAYVKNAQIEMR